jgi:hypothetical protein
MLSRNLTFNVSGFFAQPLRHERAVYDLKKRPERRADSRSPEPRGHPRYTGKAAFVVWEVATLPRPHRHQDQEVGTDLIGREVLGVSLKGVHPERAGPMSPSLAGVIGGPHRQKPEVGLTGDSSIV